nr:MAG TPA: hypothetical protein [Caudoviricetes sp.]
MTWLAVWCNIISQSAEVLKQSGDVFIGRAVHSFGQPIF